MEAKDPAVYNRGDTFMSLESNVSDITTDLATTTSTCCTRKRSDVSSMESSKHRKRESITDNSLLSTGKYTKRLSNPRLHFPKECVLIGKDDKGKEVQPLGSIIENTLHKRGP